MANTQSSNICRKQLHVAMFPWLAFGHIIPYLQLSKFIAEKGHKVSFISTKRNIQRLPTLPSNLKPFINLVQLTLPRVHELPQNAEATMDVRSEDVQYLKKAFDGLEPELTRFLEQESPDWIIYDFAPYWLPSVAAGLGISRAHFMILNAWFTSFLGRSSKDIMNGYEDRKTVADFMLLPKWVPFPTKLTYRKYEAQWLLETGSTNASGFSDLSRFGMLLKWTDCMFIKHCNEFEPQWLTLLKEQYHIPVMPVGLLPPETTIVSDEKDDTWMTIKMWLDGQPKGGVVYVALGSEVMMTKTEVGELALGIELSGLPFFWALRKPAGSTESYSVELPDGFLERTRDRGMVWTSWAPQLQILGHQSVGGFLTHCGWGSIVEGLIFGHPLIMLPFLVDQGLNARMMVDKQVGIEVQRNEQDGSFTKDSVARSLTSVMANDEGKIYKVNAMELSQIFSDTKIHKKYVDDFIEYLEKKRESVLLLSTHSA
ncbi:UDP-glycosyltransferase 91D2-like [Rutidosis leptorrhynchoides]|uniref:UDP-glycosyltransferase 91D2-like n=1 Tax=Rutidosis leptorrhynchoides TaxID=125765 RepID=UPI003A99C316